jgi:hypothetical protein
MSGGRFHHAALTGAYDKSHLLEHGRSNGIDWQEDGHEGVNWLRFSTALHRHLDGGGQFHLDNGDPEALKTMLNNYRGILDAHKKTMVPHVRAAMAKLYMEHGDGSKSHMDFLKDAYEHLEANGGHQWAEKVSVLSNLNKHVNSLTERLSNMGHKV